MAKGKYAKKRQVVEKRTEREEFQLWLYEQMIAATYRQEDAAKAMGLINKHTQGRRLSFWEEVAVMDNFRKIEQGTPEGKEISRNARYAGKGNSKKRKR